MRVVFLGTGGYYANDRRHTAGILLPEMGVVLDAGTSLFRLADRLQRRDLQIFLTHAHLDHVIGLTYLLMPMLKGQIQRARVYGQQETLLAVQNHLFAQPLFPMQPKFQYVVLQEVVPVPGDGQITHVRLAHPGGSVGYRIDWPAGALKPAGSLAYITDTTADRSYLHFVQGVDLLIHECYFSDDMAEWSATTGHSCTSRVAELARDAAVGRLVLVHINPERTEDDPVGMRAALSIFPSTELAEDLMELEI